MLKYTVGRAFFWLAYVFSWVFVPVLLWLCIVPLQVGTVVAAILFALISLSLTTRAIFCFLVEGYLCWMPCDAENRKRFVLLKSEYRMTGVFAYYQVHDYWTCLHCGEKHHRNVGLGPR